MSHNSEKKEGILPSVASPQPPLPPSRFEKVKRAGHPKLFIVLAIYCVLRFVYGNRDWFVTDEASALGCPQVDAVTPEKNLNLWNELNDKISTPEFQQSAIDWLGGAVRVPTESFDNMDPVGVDPRWEAFGPFHDYLLNAFPLVHANLKLTKVNTYGLYYEWKGSDASLKPLLLAAHQDVVPVDPTTVDQWTHPPYSGFFDGERIWGRGSSDDKSGLIGILSTIETLITAEFQPVRTVVLAFGFDEEASGFQGAGNLGPFLEKVYGGNGFAMVVDEGSGFAEQYGSVIATPGIAEKGFLNVLVEVTAPGGHSSIPPAHTSIGILSALLVHYEQNPYPVKLSRHEPVYDTLQCVAEHGKSVPSKLRSIIKKSAHSNKALHALQAVIRKDKVLSSLVGTTQAIDLIQGGVKSNALPEQAWAIVNHRISVVSSVDAVKEHDTNLLKSLGDKFNLTYNAFGSRISEEGAPASGSLTLSDAFHGGLEPAPITPTGKDAAPYQLLSGTIQATYNAHRAFQNADSVIVAPSMMSGNTDTRFYWNLSPHIFRYNHHNAGSAKNPLGGIHTVNEFAEIDAFLEMIRFFTTLILNTDESTSL
jgi:Gly-Xaa carboxypeptidase